MVKFDREKDIEKMIIFSTHKSKNQTLINFCSIILTSFDCCNVIWEVKMYSIFAQQVGDCLQIE